NPRNDDKYKLIDLYFGYFHDVGCNNISGPESGLAQTFPVTCHVKNFGQYNESDFNTYVEIAEIDLDNSFELLNEDFSSSTFPPDGWTKTHNNWMYSQTNKAGGTTGEARFYYYPSSNDTFRLFTPAIDTSDYEALKIKFKHYVYHYITPYNLKVEISEDGINWETLWEIEPSGNVGPESINIVTDKNISSNMYISWTFEGNSYNINYWYVDDIIIEGYCTLEPEYQDYQTVSIIEPGEELKINLSDWKPEFLQYETTGIKKYIVKGWTELVDPEDKNPDNDLFKKPITLKFLHDVLLFALSSPKYHMRWPWEILYHYDDGTTVDSFGLTNGGTFEYAIRLTPDEIGLFGGEGYTSKISNIKRQHSWNNSFQMSGKIKIYKEGTATHPGDIITEEQFECFDSDWHEIVLSEPVEITGDEDIWISCEVSHDAGQNPAAMDPLGPVYGKSDWLYINSEWIEAYEYGIYTDWNLRVGIDGSLPPQPCYVINSGIQDINITVANFGTFPELDLSCYAEIYELITDPENLSLVYEDTITDIDLDKPVGGLKYLEFEDYNFSMEGIYVLLIKMPDKDDDNPRNNERGVSIHVDETSPYSDYPPILDPPEPDGENGWYVNDITVTLNATDPRSNGVCSGIEEIRYTINGGAEQVIPGKTGSFVLTEDGDDILIEYWAVDGAGNVEEKKNLFTIDIDQTVPDISLSYEVSGNKLLGWKFTFYAMATDEMSNMNRVEIYLNDLIQETIVGPGPEYEWTIKYDPIPNAHFKATAFDNAGLFDTDEIVDPTVRPHSHSKIIHNFFQNLIRLYEQFPILQRLFLVLGGI
ncbi:MAG: hypothetical protein JSU91_07565, partial [Thermoplasmatales archaeon]